MGIGKWAQWNGYRWMGIEEWVQGNEYMGMLLHRPSLLTTYRPMKPVAPNTVATMPLNEERPPAPFFIRELLHRCMSKKKQTATKISSLLSNYCNTTMGVVITHGKSYNIILLLMVVWVFMRQYHWQKFSMFGTAQMWYNWTPKQMWFVIIIWKKGPFVQ